MKSGKIIALLLALALLGGLCTALAVDESRSFSFVLTSDLGGGTVGVGDEFTVHFTLKRTDAEESWAMYAWQTEIAYDTAVFELVADSIIAASGVGSSFHEGAGQNKVYFNAYSYSKSGTEYPAVLEAGSFRLRVIGTAGDTAIKNTNYKVSTAAGADHYAVRAEDLTVSVNGSSAVKHFVDVPDNAWFAEAVAFVVRRGLFQGVSETEFAPNMTMTRAMIVTVLHRLEGTPAPKAASGFQDVPAGTWYTEAVAWASENGVVNGYSEASFGPNDPVTREQLATILYRYASWKGYDVSGEADLSAYKDAGEISSWALQAISWANAIGLVRGRSADELAPVGTATRAEVATMLMRFCLWIEGQ